MISNTKWADALVQIAVEDSKELTLATLQLSWPPFKLSQHRDLLCRRFGCSAEVLLHAEQAETPASLGGPDRGGGLGLIKSGGEFGKTNQTPPT